MGKGRLEAFSDGVLAIIITIMVLELHAPHDASLESLRPLLPSLMSYALSFVYVGIYWNNHHHMLHAAKTISGPVMWANLHLLFWLSLTPFVTAWMGENFPATWPMAVYGANLFMCAIAYTILAQLLVRHEGKDSALARAIGADFKGWVSLCIYAVGVAGAFIHPLIAFAAYILVAVIWFVPDRRVERTLEPADRAKTPAN